MRVLNGECRETTWRTIAVFRRLRSWGVNCRPCQVAPENKRQLQPVGPLIQVSPSSYTATIPARDDPPPVSPSSCSHLRHAEWKIRASTPILTWRPVPRPMEPRDRYHWGPLLLTGPPTQQRHKRIHRLMALQRTEAPRRHHGIRRT